ncbi:hypothetical protein GCM10007063_09000 [Lentibacillus kapialis]|uniref:Uncharacterized protein n=1 Tax=Lentibacillus kapialis TaxID=340214 RepID=A0A917PRQ0_9BACI|nr:CBO0543 family protein [Lentibacillus kapialis]GGJ88682.1 hypothetical protein GCM10007063_09000 [Lentibacillus kapialis]
MAQYQSDILNKIRSMVEEVAQSQIEYWKSFSSFDSWQFWILMLMSVVPLIVLFIFIDKRKMLLLGFYGLNIHVWMFYVDVIARSFGLWDYPYELIPILPSFSLDGSLIPVAYMLLYQWTLNNKKNFYLYSLLLSAIYTFGVKAIMHFFHFFHMHDGMNYVYLFFVYVIVFIVSKLITNLFLWLQQKEIKEENH